MKVLSVRHPWAYAISAGLKDVENRTRSTAYRGLLAIQASLKMDSYALRPISAVPQRNPVTDGLAAFCRAGGPDGLWQPRDEGTAGDPLLACGAIIAVVEVMGCHTSQWDKQQCSDRDVGRLCSPWAVPGSAHWQLANARPLATPIVFTGALGLRDLPAEVESAVLQAMVSAPSGTTSAQ